LKIEKFCPFTSKFIFLEKNLLKLISFLTPTYFHVRHLVKIEKL